MPPSHSQSMLKLRFHAGSPQLSGVTPKDMDGEVASWCGKWAKARVTRGEMRRSSVAEHRSQVERKGRRPVRGRLERGSAAANPDTLPEAGTGASRPTVNSERRRGCSRHACALLRRLGARGPLARPALLASVDGPCLNQLFHCSTQICDLKNKKEMGHSC